MSNFPFYFYDHLKNAVHSLTLHYFDEPSGPVEGETVEGVPVVPEENLASSKLLSGEDNLDSHISLVSKVSSNINSDMAKVKVPERPLNIAASSSKSENEEMEVAFKGRANPKVGEEGKSNMASLKDVVSSCKFLEQEWAKKNADLDKCGKLLDKLKVGLTYLMFLPTSNTSASQEELLLARNILEIGAQWSIAKKDIPSFERYMAQLKCYYLDYRDQLIESAYKYQLLGLNLLFLLSQNRVAEFHTELELLPSDQIQSNVYIRHPLSLEQYLMEGSYNKIFLAKGNVPAESYNFFMDILLDTIRNEIGACLEKAYEKISLNEATRMLNLPSQQAMKEYGAKKKWTLRRDNFFYFNTVEAKTDNVLPSSELAEQAINYARELEMIV